MKTALSLAPASLLCALLLVAPAGAQAAPAGQETGAKSLPPSAVELSAAKKKSPRARVRVYRRYYGAPYYYGGPYYAAPYAYYPWPVYRGSDPAFTAGSEMRYRRAIGQCVFDLGYGRFESCHSN
ncbi:MAG: hypothetical protein K8H87_11695 [Pseudorhodoplanes sp.]|nr:hypothetical protein [Pseudorhodoplanes sp.]